MPLKVRGPYFNKDKGLWKIQLVGPDGSVKEVTKASKEEILKVKAQALAMAKAQGGAVKPIRHRTPDGSLGWYGEACDKLARRILQDPTDGTILSAARAFSQLLGAKKACADTTAMEAEVAEIKQAIAEIMSTRKHGTGTQGRTESRPGRTRQT